MFYMKYKGHNLEITEENVFTCCPVCGKEFPVDISGLFQDGEADLYATSIYCPECATRDGNAILGRV